MSVSKPKIAKEETTDSYPYKKRRKKIPIIIPPHLQRKETKSEDIDVESLENR